jgi:hypothetical protein
MSGYPNWGTADVNGTNVIYSEGSTWYLYWKAQDSVVRYSTSTDGANFTYQGALLPVSDQMNQRGVNDMKKVNGSYLWAYHYNHEQVWYSVGTTPTASNATVALFNTTSEPQQGVDRCVDSIGWVTTGTRLLGALYGASPMPAGSSDCTVGAGALSNNAIYARWLQKKAFFSNAFTGLAWMKSVGPDNVILMMVPGQGIETGTLTISDVDGTTPVFPGVQITIRQGDVWEYRP